MFCSRGQLCANGHIDHCECQAAAAVEVVVIGGETVGGEVGRRWGGGGVLRSTQSNPSAYTLSHTNTNICSCINSSVFSTCLVVSLRSRSNDTVELQAPSGQSGHCNIIHTALQARGWGGSPTCLNLRATVRLYGHVKGNQVVTLVTTGEALWQAVCL